MSGGGSSTSRSTRDLICHAGAGAAAGLFFLFFTLNFELFVLDFCCVSMRV